MFTVTLTVVLIPSPAHAAGYVVQPGDTLESIAQRQGTSVAALLSANGISNKNFIRIGQYLQVPAASSASGGTAGGSYRVQWGDTLIGISLRFGVPVATIRSMNPNLGQYLLAGSLLNLCTSCSSAGASTTAGAGGKYQVQAGDTLYGIASRYGVSPSSLASANGINNWGQILVGAWLSIPGASTGAAASENTSAYDPSSAQAVIQSWAQYYGISSSLPLAIAWQESGFNQSVVSATGAVGVMQVEPYTADIIARYIGRPLDLNSLDDNIHAGVFWLTHLLAYYGWNEQSAIAAYYEGTRALRLHGMYTDTVQYVNNVLALQSRFGG